MKSITCLKSVRYSEQPAAVAPSKAERRAQLIQHAILRGQVQSAIAELIRGYEVITSLSVVRVEYQPETCQVILEAVPVS